MVTPGYQPEKRSIDPIVSSWNNSTHKGRLWYDMSTYKWKYWNGQSIIPITATDVQGESYSASNILPIPSGTVDPEFSTVLDSITTWGDYYTSGSISNVDAPPNISGIEWSIVHDTAPGIRHGDGTISRDNQLCHVINYWIHLHPGDRLVYTGWIKTDPDVVGGPGAIFGIDLYGPNTPWRLWEVCPQASGNDEDNFDCLYGNPKTYDYEYVPFNAGWTSLKLDVTVPTWQFTIDDYGTTFPAQYCNGGIPWVGASWNNGESASTWFSDIIFNVCRGTAWF